MQTMSTDFRQFTKYGLYSHLLLTFTVIALCFATVLSTSVGSKHIGGPAHQDAIDFDEAPRKRALTQSPLNHAALVGETVVLVCSVAEPPPGSRVMWGEYITQPGVVPSIISDNGEILESHPNKDRYRIVHNSPTEFNLEIRDITLADGGRYVCQDTLASSPAIFRGEAELIVLEANPTCNSTVPANGIVLDQQNFTAECIVHYQGLYAPTMTWTGPEPFITGQSPPNPTVLWSGVAFTVQRTFDFVNYTCRTNFSDIGNVPPDVASNPPTWEHTYSTPSMFVYWGPTNIYATPMKDEYAVGDVLTCHADAFPVPFYHWQNMRTLEIFYNQTFTITQDMLGFNQTLRCRAQNLINGFVYTANLFIPAYVPEPSTEPTTPSTLPTTTPPAESACLDLTGHWVSQSPYAEMFLQVVHDSEIGEIRGIMKNRTDTYWVEVIGSARRGDFLYIGLTVVWPFENGITGIAGECHRCYGKEELMTEGLWRSVAGSSRCEVGSTPSTDSPYRFHRRASTTSKLQLEEFDVYNPTKEVSGQLGIKLKRR